MNIKNNWQTKKLCDVCLIIGGGTPSKTKKEFYSGDIYWATVRDMKTDIIKDTEYKITREALKKSSSNLIPHNNVVIATRVGLGKVSLLQHDTAINQDLKGIIPKDQNVLDYKFLFLWFKNISKIIEAHGTGATVKGVKLSFINNLDIPIPELSEQKRIVKILDEAFEKIERAKENAEKNLQNSRELSESFLKQIFNTTNGEFRNLGEICENLDSKRVPVTKRDRASGEYPYYGASGVVDYVNSYIFDNDLLLVSEDGANLLTRTYPIAFSISGKTWVNNHAHVLKFENKISQKFYEFYLNSIDLSRYVNGMAQPKLNQSSLNSIKVPVISISEQTQIVEQIDKISNSLKLLENNYKKMISCVEELKESTLNKAFAGEL